MANRCNSPPDKTLTSTLQQVSQLSLSNSPSKDVPFFHCRSIIALFQNITYCSSDAGATWDRIDVLRLDSGLHPVLQNLSEKILEFGTSKMDQDFLPIRGVFVSSQVWFALSTQNFECRRFSNTIGTYEAQYLSRTRCRQTMELERVWTKPMSSVPLQVLGEIDNVDCFERTFFDTNTASCVDERREKQVCVSRKNATKEKICKENKLCQSLTDT